METIQKLIKAKNYWQVIPKINKTDLVKAIKLASDHYYNKATSLISDEIYDALVEKLKAIDPNSPVLNQVGAPISGDSVELPYRLGSMEKIKTDTNVLNRWIHKYTGPYVISDKLDGVSCLVTITKGEIKLYTRGDATHGRDITYLAKYVKHNFDKIPVDEGQIISMRGELVVTKRTFKRFNKIMTSPRAMVIGVTVAKRKNLVTERAKALEFVGYEIIEPQYKPLKQFKQMEKWGVRTAHYELWDDIDLDKLEEYYETRKKDTWVDIDGIIVTDNHVHTRDFLKNPPYSFAYKGPSETANVKVIEILWKPSKDGYIIPRIHYEEAKLSQASLNYATGFNARFIMENKLGPGAVITITRSNEVMPYILHVVKKAKQVGMPDQYEYYWDDNCVNIILSDPTANVDVTIQALKRFVTTIGVKHMSEGIVTKLVANGYNTIKKVLQMTISDYKKIDGIQDKLANKLHQSVADAISSLTIAKLMTASNIFGRGFAMKKIDKILDVYPNIVTEYRKKDRALWTERIKSIEGFEDKTANKFIDNMSDFQRFYKSLSNIITIKPVTKKKKKGSRFNGMNLVFTGFTGKDWIPIIESEGGKVSSGVSKNTTLLVYADADSSSGKMTKADQLGISKMSKDAFAKKYKLP